MEKHSDTTQCKYCYKSYKLIERHYKKYPEHLIHIEKRQREADALKDYNEQISKDRALVPGLYKKIEMLEDSIKNLNNDIDNIHTFGHKGFCEYGW